MGVLTERQRELLRLIIEDYVSTARPVASEAIVRQHGLNVSSATVRNDMVELERAGYIQQLHTSAGRVPTDRGYRLYVEDMSQLRALTSAEERTIQHQFYQVQKEMEVAEWTHLAAAVLARTARYAALVSSPRVFDCRLKHVELVGIQDTLILLVVVLHEGIVKQQMITLDQPVEQSELSVLSNRLNATFAGANREQIQAKSDNPTGLEKEVLDRLLQTMRGLDEKVSEEIYHDGVLNILEQPEFSQIDRVRRLMEIIEDGTALTSIFPTVLSTDGVMVLIGAENELEEMKDCSVVLARYGIDGELAGVLGVLGPTRMTYGRSIYLVGYMSRLMSDLLGYIHRQ
jgi:heat-inducible transcriptional repressor